MDITPYLTKQCIELETDASDKNSVLREIARLAGKNPALQSFSEDDIYTKLREREEISTTAFGKDIAIPHCFFNRLESFVIGLVVSKKGIDFQSIDGSSTKVFVFMIGPSSRRNEHITILSGFSKLLLNRESVEFLINSQSVDEVYNFITEHIRFKSEEPKESGAKCLFHVFVQEETLFQDVLQLFSASASGSINVIESNNAGSYLNTMPLFAAFWTEQHTQFNRIILAVVDKSLSNDIIRQINTLSSSSDEPGILITVQELFYSSGSINF